MHFSGKYLAAAAMIPPPLLLLLWPFGRCGHRCCNKSEPNDRKTSRPGFRHEISRYILELNPYRKI
jgi:hypothetical protein